MRLGLPRVQALLGSSPPSPPSSLCRKWVCVKQKVSSALLISQATWSLKSWEYCPGSPRASPHPSTQVIPEAPRDLTLQMKLDTALKMLQEAQNPLWKSLKTCMLLGKFISVSSYSGPPRRHMLSYNPGQREGFQQEKKKLSPASLKALGFGKISSQTRRSTLDLRTFLPLNSHSQWLACISTKMFNRHLKPSRALGLPGGPVVKNLPANAGHRVRFLVGEDTMSQGN